VAAADDLWKRQAESFGSYLRAQRRLADLSLRELAAMTDVSNAYLSQVERGQHHPSVRVLRSLAEALNITAEQMLTQAGLLEPDGDSEAPQPAPKTDDARRGAKPGRRLTESAILSDPELTDAQKQALLAVYNGFLEASS
jgi:transcriptional regulator with XRE-family HTH domain